MVFAEFADARIDVQSASKASVMDVDYPDMPLGGWAGTVTEVQGNDTFTVRWSKQTMGSIHPVFLQRCEIDGLDAEVYVLTGDDLESVSGQWTTADGLKTEVVTVTIVAGDDIAEYDPEEDADLYEYWKAETRYWEAG